MKAGNIKGLILVIVYLISNTAHADTIDVKKLDKYLTNMVAVWDVPAMSIGVVKDGKLVFTGNYGSTIEGGNTKPDANTLYAMASNTKAFTSAIIAMLVQEGKLDWNDKVKKYLPYFELYQNPWISGEVTVKDLLCHRVGLGTFSGDAIWYKSTLTAEELLKKMTFIPQAYGFRDGYGYSNYMFITAGELIKTVTGKSWAENVKTRILDPLKMDRTVTSLDAVKKIGNYATPHRRFGGKNLPIEWVDWETVGATGGIISSVNDVAKWMIFNLNQGINGKDTLISENSRNMMWSIQNSFNVNQVRRDAFDTHFRGYGLGWVIGDYKGKMRVYHTGGYDGFITTVNLIPDENLGVVVLTNGLKTPYMAAALHTLDHYLGNTEVDWSGNMLVNNEADKEDVRISKMKNSKAIGTKVSLKDNQMAGMYFDPVYGTIEIRKEGEKWRIYFEHTPEYAASLEHWHYDTWTLKWDVPSAWFSFGTVKFIANNNNEVTGLGFEVPNDDIFFEELNPVKKQ